MPQGTIPPNPQLIPLPIAAPGSLGLNLQQASQVLPPQWAIEAQNCVIDIGGRVAARNGFAPATSVDPAGTIRAVFEYRTPTGGSVSIVAFDGGISSSIPNPSGSSLVGTISSVASGRWYFQNFNGKCIGFQSGQKPIVMQNTGGTFSNIVESNGSAPQGGVGCAAFGRLWGMNADGQTLQWCALLDETNWGSGDSGSINLAKVWPLGGDTVTAIVAFNGALVIFGLRQILFYGSSNPSAIGLDVTTIQLVDTLEGTGCVSQWSTAAIGETDLAFCSKIGIQSLQRLLIQKSRPTTLLSKYCRDAIITQIAAETTNNISGFYSPTQGFYALILPTSGYVWVADLRHVYTDEDGDTVSRMTRWNVTTYTGAEFFNRSVYFNAPWDSKALALYNSSSGDNNVAFQFILQLPFMDFGQNLAARLKALKRVGALIYSRANTNVTFTWYADFNTSGNSSTVTTGNLTGAEWGTAQWAIDQWSGGTLLTLLRRPASGSGQYFSLAITAQVASNFAVQQANLMAKLLRLA